MKYDITSKLIAGNGKQAIFRFFEKRQAVSLELIESLPQELPDIKKGDFLLKVTGVDGNEEIHIWEFKTRWNPRDVENLMVYTLRARQTYHLPVKPVMFLFLPSESASGHYNDRQFQFEFEMIKMWEEDAQVVLNTDDYYLYPFIPLMKADENIILEAEKKLYNSDLQRKEKSDLVTAMVIFAGLKDQGMSQQLIRRRRDIVIESYAYDILREMAMEDAKKEAMEEAVKVVGEEYKKKGLEEGLFEGRKEGRKEGLQEAIQIILEVKFGDQGLALIPRVRSIDSLEKLEELLSVLRTADSIPQVEAVF